jgi:hypothetical protein
MEPSGGGGTSTVASATENTTFPPASFFVKCSLTATADALIATTSMKTLATRAILKVVKVKH